MKWSEARGQTEEVTGHWPHSTGQKIRASGCKTLLTSRLKTHLTHYKETTCKTKRIVNYFHDISRGRIPLIPCAFCHGVQAWLNLDFFMLPLALSAVNGLPHSPTEAASECRMSKQVLVTQNTWIGFDGCEQAAASLTVHWLRHAFYCRLEGLHVQFACGKQRSRFLISILIIWVINHMYKWT